MQRLSRITPSIIRSHALALTLILSTASCSTVKQVHQSVVPVTHDTLYKSNLHYDSIYIQNEHEQEYRRDKRDSNLSTLSSQLTVDTIFIRDKSKEYKYRLLRDTTYINRVDTVPIIHEVEVESQSSPVPWYKTLLSWIGLILITLLLLQTARNKVIK